ncbi:hypothetical protein LEMLEM_LOCUS18708 [Lemmus lemmus]
MNLRRAFQIRTVATRTGIRSCFHTSRLYVLCCFDVGRSRVQDTPGLYPRAGPHDVS